MGLRPNRYLIMLLLALFLTGIASLAVCQDKIEKYIPDMVSAENGMTLWQIIKSGGEVMILLAFLSVIAVALITYYFLTMKRDKLIPDRFLEKITLLIKSGKNEEVKVFCQENPNLISDITLAALPRIGKGKGGIEEAIQDRGKRSVTTLWQRLSYLADIAAISPMVGLLGTVLGMIQAFNVIAFQAGAVKPILLASGISKAMVTTAAGLIIAIPAMIFYSYFRGVVQDVISEFEHVSSELLHAITER